MKCKEQERHSNTDVSAVFQMHHHGRSSIHARTIPSNGRANHDERCQPQKPPSVTYRIMRMRIENFMPQVADQKKIQARSAQEGISKLYAASYGAFI